MSKTLYMETTSISVIKTCAEIEEALLSFGVKQFWKEYENQSVSGIAFIIEKEGQTIPIKLPFRWKAIKQLADNGKTKYKSTKDSDQAQKIAARIILNWIKSQLSLIELDMVELEEVFLPYIMIDNQNSVYDKFKSQKLLQENN